MKFSSRVRGLAESETLRLFSEVACLRARGQDVVSLLEGEPDLPAPAAALRATAQALRQGRTRYSSSSGLLELKALIARKLTRENAVPAGPENILIANGAKQALYETLQTLAGPGDEILIPSPCWVTFPEAVKLAGAKPVLVPTRAHQLDVNALRKAVTAKTKAIILNTPNNPTGAVYPEAALRAVADLAERRGLTIISDEAYERLVYDGRRHRSVASLGKKAFERTVTIQTLSKSFSMTGFRVGYLAAPVDFVQKASRLHGHMTGNVCTFVQHGAMAALRLGPGEGERRRAGYQKRRDLAYRLGTKLFDCLKPRGGLFLFADVRRYLGSKHKDSAALAGYLLREAKVAVVPGSAFGAEGFVRISFSGSEQDLRQGFARMERAL